MRSLARVLVIVAVLVSLGVGVARQPRTHDDVFHGEGLLEADAGELKMTVVSPHLETAIKEGTNVLWCGSFQLVWNEVCSLIGEDLHFEGEPGMVGVLNKKSFTKEDIDDESYIAVAGFVKDDIFEKIDKALEEKFKGQASPKCLPDKSLTPRPQDFVAYSYMFKNLEFEVPFERLSEPLVFDDVEVPCFGFGEFKKKHASMYPQVLILDYEDQNSFVIELKTKSKNDRVILAKVQAGKTLGATITTVQQRAAGDPVEPSVGDELRVPKLNFDVTREYVELRGLRLVTENPDVAKDLQILSAIQNTRFLLDEKGVRLRSESHISGGCAAVEPPPKHVMVFDKPFLIMLQIADAKTPYFALWVDNAELLVGSAEVKKE